MSDAEIARLVDLSRYPLLDPDIDAGRELVDRARRDLAACGCSVLRGFIRPDQLDELRREGADLASASYDTVETVNAYNLGPDAVRGLPDEHPARIPMRRGNAFVARDRIPADAIVHRLYTSRAFQRFVALCFGLPALYELGDPLAGLVLNVITPGREHPWHFDTNEFTVSMLTQAPDRGGEFEYCPNIRTPQRENLDAVRAVVTGADRTPVRRLVLDPGDLQLFQGRYALHRVCPPGGGRSRHTAIFAYSERPGVIGTVARTRQLFGRVLPEHEAAASKVRVDALLD
ncbi:MAG: arpA protein [Mycobacteriaceae bacterium]|nr:arpA protein [Mycobacteriaceae bacterium]